MSLINSKSGFKFSFGWFKTKPGRRSTSDWMWFLLVIFIFTIISLIFHLFVFLNVEKDSSASVSPVTTNVETLDRDALKKAVNYLEVRKGGPATEASSDSDISSTTIPVSLPSLGQ